MLSTLLGNTYGSYSGTSMVMPHVADVPRGRCRGPHKEPEHRTGRRADQVDAPELRRQEDQSGRQGPHGGWLNAARHRTVSDGVAGQLPAGSRVRPVFGSTVREMTPTVAATVRDRRTNLAKGGDRRYVDGSQENTSSYSSATDRLHYRSSRLYDDRHAVRIVAPEASGNRVDECWNVVIRMAARGTTGTDGDLSRPFLMPSERASYGVRDEGDRGERMVRLPLNRGFLAGLCATAASVRGGW